jgi:hypothetical protein
VRPAAKRRAKKAAPRKAKAAAGPSANGRPRARRSASAS